jgi:Ca-activated chloride channel family protein
MDLIVTDKANHFVDDFDRSDLQIFEDGKLRQLESVSKESKPVKYALVIDGSMSFRGIVDPALETCKAIVDANSAGDETALIRFVSSDKIARIQDFTSDKARLAAALKAFYLEGGGSAVIDGLYEAIKSVTGPANGQRAVVLITDGEDRKSANKIDDLVKILRASEIKVFAIGVVVNLENDAGYTKPSPRAKAEELLNRVARESGGRAFFPRNISELQAAGQEVVHDLHLQTKIVYRSPEQQAKGFHKVEVKIGGQRKLKALTRPGYVIN